MDFQPVYDQIQVSSLEVVGKTQTNIDARLLPATGDNIVKVLSISASPKVKISEIFTGEARIAGEVEFCVLYLSADGKNRVMRYSVQFTDKVSSPYIYSDSAPVLTNSTPVVEVTAVSSEEIKLSAVVESTLYLPVSKQIKCLLGGDGAYFNQGEIKCENEGASSFDIFTLESAEENFFGGEVLTDEHRVVVTDSVALPGVVKVSGVVISDICFEKEEGLLSYARIETPFVREIEAVGCENGDKIYAFACVEGRKSDEDRSSFVYTVRVSIFDFREKTVAVASDIFSPEREILISAESEEITRLLPVTIATERVDGTITLDGGASPADNILAYDAVKAQVVSAVALDGETLVEGVISGNIVYYSAEAESENSVTVELPFSIKESNDLISEGDILDASVVVSSVSAKVRRGNEIDIRYSVYLTVIAKRTVTSAVITEAREGEEKQKNSCAFTVHIVKKGETLWSVSKILGCTTDEIIKQNPSLSDELIEGERIIIYRCNC